MTITGARNFITVPAVDVARGGVISVARVIDVTDPHDLLGAEYLTDACAEGNRFWEFCGTDDCSGEGDAKVFDDGPELVEGDPMALYTGTSCTLSRQDEALARVKRRFDYAERRLVDLAIFDWLDGVSQDLGTAADVTEALGIAEAYAAGVYGGVATIVAPVAIVTQMCGDSLLTGNLDGSLMTCQGSRVANVAYPPPTPSHIYVTGQITLLRGAVMAFTTPQQMKCDGTTEPARALAERIYVPLVECIVGKVTVTP